MTAVQVSEIEELLEKIEPVVQKKKTMDPYEWLPFDDPYSEGFDAGIRCTLDTIRKAIKIIKEQ